MRDKIGSFRSRDDMQLWLNDWVMNYVDGDPSISTEATKAKRPLAAAEVQVEDVEDDPGFTALTSIYALTTNLKV